MNGQPKKRFLSRRYLHPLSLLLLVGCSSHYLTEQGRRIHEELVSNETILFRRFMENTIHQTPVFRFRGSEGGPAVLIIGGTHGNEKAGFEAAYRLLRRFADDPPDRGTLFLLPEANRRAVLKDSRRIRVPEGVEAERGNLNRCYPGDPEGLPMERMAYLITELIRREGIDLLLDLHESRFFHLEKKEEGAYSGLGQTLIYTPDEEATWLGMVTLDRLNSTIPAGVKRFSMVERPIPNSAAWSAGVHHGIPAFTTETCRKLPLEERIEYQVRIVMTILEEIGMIS